MESSSRHVHTEHMGHGNTHEMHEVHGGPPNAEMHSSHDHHAGHSVAMFRDKFWLSLALTLPVVLWSSEAPTALRSLERVINFLSVRFLTFGVVTPN
jgi:hypothetical protein